MLAADAVGSAAPLPGRLAAAVLRVKPWAETVVLGVDPLVRGAAYAPAVLLSVREPLARARGFATVVP